MRRRVLLLIAILLITSSGARPLMAQSPAEPAKELVPAVGPATLRDLPLDVRLKIDPDLHKALLEARSDAERRGVPPEPLTYLVSLKARASFHDLAASPSPEARRQLLVERLQATAAQSQAPVVSYLSAQRARGQVSDYRSYWVFNGLAVDGDLETALALAAMPEVEAVRANRPHRLPTPSSAPGLAIAGENIRQIGADRVWSELGVTGEGIVVANLDSGVDWTHPALREQYRGYNPQNPAASVHDYNWFDATDTYPNAPGPNQGRLTAQSDHGTHTMGTMVGAEPDGSNQVGVAPGARWIAAKVFDNAGNSWDEWIHAGFQWCIAPTDLNGQTPDPSKAPHIVNCSWGDSNSLDDTFVQDVAALREAGIMSIWAAGNDGPGASTISSPASFPGVFGVGAVDSGNVIAQFSSRGPSPFGGIKPEVVAPGVRIRSTVAGGGYESSWNGTSMAAPHVAGVVALMWEAADGRISITDTERILTVVGTGIDLGQEGPDNVYGYGLVQAPAAVEEAIRWAKAYGYLFGWVRNALTGAPIEGARLVATDARTRERRETATDASGFYRLMLPSGRYDVTASEFLHESGSVSGVNVLSGVATQLDLRLQPAKAGVGVLAGKVTSRATGAPIAATVRLAGTIAQAKTDAQGEYQLLAPAGSYAVRITANVPGYLGEEVAGVTVRPQETTRVDRSLDAIPRILLVDAEAWRGDRGATYQAQALDVLLYSHDLWQVRNPPSDVPSANKMGSYDVVIWVQPKYSPGYISAWGVLGAYLDGGGALLMSGQDIGYWDQAQGYAPTDYRRFLGVRYQADDGGLGVISGLAGKLLDGLQLTPNTTDSAANQTEPDALALADALTEGVCTYPSGQLAGVQLSACLYRAVYFGFGLEGVGPLASRAEAMRRAISWLVTPQTKEGVRVLLEQQAQGATIGTTARYPLTLANSGSSMDSYTLVITSPTWPARLVDAATRRPITETSMLAPCGRSELWLEVSVPADARTAAEELTRVEVRSKRFAGATATVAVATTAIQPWESGPAMAVARYRLAVAAQGCQLYAIGGFDREDRALSSVGILDTTTRAWRSGSPKPTVSGNSAAVALAGAIHLLGGYDPNAQGEYLASHEVYDPASDTWRQARPLPTPLSGVAAAAARGRVYVFGGNAREAKSLAAYAYSPELDTWSEVAPVPTDELSFAQAVALDDIIYVAGGWPNRRQLLRYDPANDAWTELAPMLVGRHSFAMVTDGRYLYVAGGGDEWEGLDAVERYDPRTNNWLQLPPLQGSNRAGAGGAYLDGWLYVVGGSGAETVPDVERLDLGAPLSGSYLALTPTLARPGETLGATLTMRNGSGAPVAASWTLSLPRELPYLGGSATGGAVYDPALHALSWSGTLPASTENVFSFSCVVAITVTDGSVLSMAARLDGGGCSPRWLERRVSAHTPTVDASEKTVDKARVAPGEALQYTIRVINGSPFTVTDIYLRDPIPAHTSLIPGSLVGGQYDAQAREVVWQGALPPDPGAGAPFAWIDATQGLALGLYDDSCSDELDLGFDLHFYDKTYNSVWVNSNGLVLFEGPDTRYANVAIPNPAPPNAFVAPLWDDLRPGVGGGDVYWLTGGAAPNRFAVVEWNKVRVYGQDAPQTFQVVLYEGSNRIICQYLTVTGARGAGSEATVGIESPDGSEGVLYLHNGQPVENLLQSGLAIELVHSSTSQASVHVVTYDVAVDASAPPGAPIVNSASIADGWATHVRVVTSTVKSPAFGQSSKRAGVTRALSGDVVAYTLRLVNSGDLEATTARLVDALPEGLDLVEGSLRGEGAFYKRDSREVIWQGSLPADGGRAEITYSARAGAALAVNTWLTNTATIYEREAPMATLAAGVLVNPVDLSGSSKVAAVLEQEPGVPIQYTITLRNSGLYAAEQVSLVDALPQGLELVPGTLVGASYEPASRQIRWQGRIGPGASHKVVYSAALAATLANGTVVTNTALIDAGSGGSHTRQAEVRVLRGDLSGSSMSATPQILVPGGIVRYDVQVLNRGSRAISATLTARPTAPLVLYPDAVFASAGEVRISDGGIVWQGNIPPDTMMFVRFGGKAPLDTPPQTVKCVAVLTDEGGLSYTLETLVAVGAGRLQYFPQVGKGWVH